MQIPAKTRPRLFLVDAYALIYRSYFAFISRPLMNAAGENTSAPFGFTRFLLDIREQFAPDYLAVVFDAGDSFRAQEYPEYKATREKMPDDLRESLGRIRQIVEAFNDPVVELEGYEADDVIGTLARQAAEQGLEAVIVSGDKDFYQLVQPHIHLMNPGRGGASGVAADWVTEQNADEKFGIPPSQVADYLALVGDSSDNVPGARGVGPKTAVQLLKQYPDVERLIENADSLKPPRASKSLSENADMVRLSKRLVTIMTDLDIELDLGVLRVQEPNNAALRDLFVELEFRRLSDQFALAAQSSGDGTHGEVSLEVQEEATDYAVVDSLAGVELLVAELRTAGRFSLAAESSHEDPLRGDLVGLALSSAGGVARYLPFGHAQSFALTFEGEDSNEVRNLPGLGAQELESLRGILEDPTVGKSGHDLKQAALVLSTAGVTLAGFETDAMIASYVLEPGKRGHELKTLSMEIFSHKPLDRSDVTGSGRSKVLFADVSREEASAYLCSAVDLAGQLAKHFCDKVEEAGLTKLLADLEMPLVPMLSRMELSGIAIDTEFFQSMRSRLKRELDLIESEIFKLAGGEFNLNSTPQLRQVLFDKLDMPVLKKTKTGPSTDASVLEELASMGHEIPRLMMEYRELEKLRSTYVEALPQLVNPVSGRIHTSFNQTVAATGRLSSSAPNLQNIPIRTDLGREIRKGFVASPGNMFLAVDYSQIELRVMAHFSEDNSFVTAFNQGIDVHRQTASVIFDVPVEDVSGGMRDQAKTVNFATLYGQGPFSLAQQLGISREEAKQFIATYFLRFSGVREFLDRQIDMAKSVGYVETLMGRRRYVPELRAGNWNVRQFGERVAQNTPIQGSAADLMKKAMISVQAALDSTDSNAKILLQVHDELLLEVPEQEVDDVRALVVDRMEGAVELRVPIVAEWGAGKSWYDCKS
ncbi:DNA polymerase I [Gemmatimonadales bacterium]|nr:DNA polymerase I [Gemmatimonadales bacterium]